MLDLLKNKPHKIYLNLTLLCTIFLVILFVLGLGEDFLFRFGKYLQIFLLFLTVLVYIAPFFFIYGVGYYILHRFEKTTVPILNYLQFGSLLLLWVAGVIMAFDIIGEGTSDGNILHFLPFIFLVISFILFIVNTVLAILKKH